MEIEPLSWDIFMIYWIYQSRRPHGVSPYFGRRDKSGFFYQSKSKSQFAKPIPQENQRLSGFLAIFAWIPCGQACPKLTP